METISLPSNLPTARQQFFNRSLSNGFEISNVDRELTLNVYDEIGLFGVSAADMRRTLDGFSGDSITLNINSPGGDVFDGIAIYNDLVAHDATVNVRVTGLAASAASLIAMAGDSIEIAENGFLMIHNAWALVVGNRNDMTEFAKTLEQIDGALARTYARRTGGSVDEMAALMDAETWLAGDDAVERGFADKLLSEGESAKALFDLSAYARVPGSLKRQIEAGLRDEGFSNREAKAAAAEGFHILSQRDAGHRSLRDGEGAKELTPEAIVAAVREALQS